MLTYHFLNFYFLERTKPASTSLHVQRATNTVLFAFRLILTVNDRGELFI